MRPPSKPALLLVLVVSSLLVGPSCGGGSACPEGTVRHEVNGANFEGIQIARDGFLCLTRDNTVVGFPVQGTYQYENSQDNFGPPIVRLAATEAESVFQKHGVTAQRIDWGILMNTNGVPVGVQSQHGARLVLFWKLQEPGYSECTPGLVCDPAARQEYAEGVGQWRAVNLDVSFNAPSRMIILGERVKACEPMCVPREGIPEQ